MASSAPVLLLTALCCGLPMPCMHAGLVECEAVGSIPRDTTRPQLHVYDRCIQSYR